MSLEKMLDEKREHDPHCGFRHGPIIADNPPAVAILWFSRPCGCVTLQVSRPSLACESHAISWRLAPTSLTSTKCSQCGRWSRVSCTKQEAI